MGRQTIGLLLVLVSTMNLFFISNAQSKDLPKSCPAKRLNKEVTLPNMPIYPGAKFVSGREFSNSGDNNIDRAYTLNYAIQQDTVERVMSWYSGRLVAEGWKIEQQSKRSVHARNERANAHCDLFCRGAENDRSFELSINYALFPRR